MKLSKRVFAFLLLAFMVIVVNNASVSAAPLADGVETLPVVKVPKNARCGALWPTAVEAGWSPKDLTTLDYIMYRESKCNTKAFNGDDPMGGSVGLTQINMFWCKPNSSRKVGFLQSEKVLKMCTELFDPETNLKAALTIFQYGESRYGKGNGFGPWNL